MDKESQLREEVLLSDNSVYVMKPGVQSTHLHKVCPGRDSFVNERGERYSLTFRRLLPSATAPSGQDHRHQDSTMSVPDEHRDCLNGLVFGSSLTKGLKADLLSHRGRKFAVFANSGASINRIIQDVLLEADKMNIAHGYLERLIAGVRA